jgi:hypothetical protein
MALFFNYCNLRTKIWSWREITTLDDLREKVTELATEFPEIYQQLVISDASFRSERTMSRDYIRGVFAKLRDRPIAHIKALRLSNMSIDSDAAMDLADMILRSPDLESVELDFASEQPSLGQATLLLVLRNGAKVGTPLKHVSVLLPMGGDEPTNHANDRLYARDTSLEAIEWIRAGTAPEWFAVTIPDAQVDNLVEALVAAKGAGVQHLNPGSANYSNPLCTICGKCHRAPHDPVTRNKAHPSWCRAHALLTIAAASHN